MSRSCKQHFSKQHALGYICLSALLMFVVHSKWEYSNVKLTNCFKSKTKLAMIKPVPQGGKGEKMVLVWKKMWSGFTGFNFKECPVSNCITVFDHSYLPQSDAVIFPGKWNFSGQLPKVRPQKQYWIYQNTESQVRSLSGSDLRYLNGKINFTWTFLNKSDIFSGYGSFQRISQSDSLGKMDYPPSGKRTKLVAWLVSHCITTSMRENYFEELAKYIEADRFGECSPTAKCQGNCIKYIAEKYKFYFAAENSVCKEYITEKLYRNAMYHGVLPIVYGGADYSKFLPAKSYIDVKDFRSPKELAAFLKVLAQNDTLYDEYFKWREEFQVIEGKQIGSCNLCEFLNKKTIPHKVHTQLEDFWNRQDCISGEEYLKTIMPKISA